ncbi:MAG: long-chain fatty acid--CoA ligase [Acidimicrobiia bacterium]|nr:MAG: long-chain fatty acid--CoA ligase [Acidimicrobiia bacterium]
MRTYVAPGEQPVEPGDNPVSLLVQRATHHPHQIALSYRVAEGFLPITTAEMLASVKELAAGLVALGVEKGDRVALYTSTRYEFTLLDYAIWAAGAATVTIYDTSSAEQVEWILGDSGSKMLVCETPAMKAIYEEVAERLPSCRHVLVIEDGALSQLSDAATDLLRNEVEQRIGEIGHGDLATLIYTSGTTGRPKGCMLTHGNLAFSLRQLEVRLPALLRDGERTLLFLPLAHIASRVIQIGCVSRGVEIAYASSVDALIEELSMVRPSWLFAVPRVFEKIYNGATHKAHAEGKGAIFDRAVNVAIAYSEGIARSKIGVLTRVQHAVFDRLVYGKLRAVFGGELVYSISAAAPLGERLGHFFRGIGLTPIEAYGLTETTGASNSNGTDFQKIGTVGPPIPGVAIGIAEDGEIMIKGGCVMAGYWRNGTATAEAIEPDGWFHSGDIGDFDEEGFLRITGRKKELIITSGGKNVAPAVLEDRLRADPLVSQCVVVGDARPFIAALVTLDEEALLVWAGANDKPMVAEDLVDDPDLVGAVQRAIDEANKAVSATESIRSFRILPNDLTIESGALTPTLKVKRSVVLEEYAGTIDEIYG